MEDWTAQIQPQDTLSLSHTHTYTQAPLDQMTALELGGIALASISPFFLFLSAQPEDTHTHSHTIQPKPDVAPGPAQTGLVCPP